MTRLLVCMFAGLCASLFGVVNSQAIPRQTGNVTKGKPMEITESSHDKTIRLAVGQKFTIELNETSGTGYRWQFVHNGAPTVSLIDDSFRADSQKMGAGGTREFLLQAVSPGHVTIEVKLSRPWEANGATRSLSFHLIVT